VTTGGPWTVQRSHLEQIVIKRGKWINDSPINYLQKININSKDNYKINELEFSGCFFNSTRSFKRNIIVKWEYYPLKALLDNVELSM